MKSEPAQVIDLALKSVNLLVLLARAICKRFSKISIPWLKMLDLRPILGSFMGDAQPSKNNNNKKNSENQTTQWRFLRYPVKISIPLDLLQRGMDKTRKSRFIFVFRFHSSVEPTISYPGTGWSAAAYRKKFVWELKRGFVHDGGPPAVSISPFPLLLTSTWKPVQLKQTGITASPT